MKTKRIFTSIILVGLILAGLPMASFGQVPRQAPIIGFTVPTDPTISQPSPNQGQVQEAFDFLSWQSFVALNWPADPQNRGFPNAAATVGGPGPVVWETFNDKYEVFQAGNPPPPPLPFNAPQQLPPGCGGASGAKVLRMVRKVSDEAVSTEVLDEFVQAMAGPLVDPQRNLIRYEIRMNLGERTYIDNLKLYNSRLQDQAAPITFPSTGTNALSEHAIEVKSAWKQLTQAEIASNRFYTSQAFLYDPSTTSPPAPATCSGPITMGLVGLHIAHKTQHQPNWIWSTFEHVANAPTQGQQIPSGATYNFYDPQCTADGAACDPNCVPLPQQNLNQGAQTCRAGQNISQVVRLTPIPDGTGQMPDGSPVPNTQALNTQWQAALAGTVWANYELVSTQWTETNGDVLPAMLANTSMETYFQDNSFGSCIMCHGTAMTASQSNTADKSFLLGSAYPHSSLLRQRPARSIALDFAGQAEQVGSGTPNGTVRVTGSAQVDGDFNLGTAKLAVRSVLREENGAGELLADTTGTSFLPVNLSPAQGSTDTKVVFETPGTAQPQLRVEVMKPDPGKGLLEFTLTATGATIPKGPALCGSGAAPTTILTSSLTLVDGTHVPVTVTLMHPWQCNGAQLKTP